MPRTTIKEVGVSNYMFRGIGYALTSVLAMGSGYIISNTSVANSWSVDINILLLLFPIFMLFYFFICYAIRFHYETKESKEKPRKEAIFLFLIMLILSYIAIISIYSHFKTQFLSVNFILALFLYCSLLLAYGTFIFFRFMARGAPAIRHQLVWPSLLSIACSLYFGLYFYKFSESNDPLYPILLLTIILIFSEYSSLRSIKAGIIGIIAIILVAVISFSFGIDTFTAMVFCISVTAYLAVFEAWRITANIARQGHNSIPGKDDSDLISISKNGDNGIIVKLYERYYYAIVAALAFSSIIAPFIFIFSDFGMIFLFGFTFHSIVTFWYWISKGRSEISLKNLNWVSRKLFFGFIFLLILVIDSFIGNRLIEYALASRSRFLPSFVSVTGLGLLALIFIYQGTLLASSRNKLKKVLSLKENMNRDNIEYRRHEYLNFIGNTYNGLRLLSLIFGIICLMLVLLIDSNILSTALHPKADLAYIAYGTYMLTILIYRAKELKGDAIRIIDEFKDLFLGMIQVARLLTSTIVGIIVFIPMYFAQYELIHSIYSALIFSLIAMGGFALNDYFDVESDKINKPHRAIPSGRITKQVTLIIAIICFCLTSAIIALQRPDIIGYFIYMTAIIGVIIYNVIIRFMSLFKNLAASFLCCLPILYVLLELGFTLKYYSLVLASFFFVVGREILMDVYDYDGDMVAGTLTIPFVISKRKAILLGFVLCILSGLSLFLFVGFEKLLISHMVVICILAMLIMGYKLWQLDSRELQRKIILAMWIPMIMGYSLILI